MLSKKPSSKPFGIEFLVPVTDAEAQQVNGGHRHKPIMHTNYVSAPSGAFPRGDHG